MGTTEISTGVKLSELLKRTEINYESLRKIDKDRPDLEMQVQNEVEIMVKYEGYILNSQKLAEKQKKLEDLFIPDNFNYLNLDGLALEARQKLNDIRPKNIGQASRISGVNPSDINVLIMAIQRGNINGK